jgi:hypothetical protein
VGHFEDSETPETKVIYPVECASPIYTPTNKATHYREYTRPLTFSLFLFASVV